MTIKRREFFKFLSCGAAVAASKIDYAFARIGQVPAVPRKKPPADAIALLYDATLCIGCKACETACKRVNEMPAEHSDWERRHGVLGTWDSGRNISTKTLSKIKLYTNGNASKKNHEINGYSFFKRHCMHCVDPACESACPVSGFTKDPQTGMVIWNTSCCGCRYCEIACPYNIPRFQYDKAIPKLYKCQLCSHIVAKGGIPGCSETCPTGATLFGRFDELLKEARRRVALKPGQEYAYPLNTVNSDKTQLRAADKYINYIYGEKEGGGTQYLILSAVPFQKIGLPKLSYRSVASITEKIQHTIYKGLISPIVLFIGLLFAVKQSTKKQELYEEENKSESQPIGGKIFTKPFLVLAFFAALAGILLLQRFFFGLGAVTNLNDGYPWGLWIVYDVLIGTAIGCGGYAMALAVYVFNRGQYHPLVRPALMTSLFGYTMAGVAIALDTGRYWNLINFFIPKYANINSVLVEVALCVTAYILVMLIEFSPVFFEKWKLNGKLRLLNKFMFVFIALGVLLPTMHQSSLGSLMIIAGEKLFSVWQTNWLPLLFLISALTMGYGMVVFESLFSSIALKRPLETSMLEKLSALIPKLLALFLTLRFGDLIWRGQLGLALSLDFKSWMFIMENVLVVYPMVILFSSKKRSHARELFLSAASILLAGSVYRFNAYLVGFDPGYGWQYFPAVSEIMITVGIISFELMAYLIFIKKLPVMPRLKHA
tara:strand:+ start:829 stop:2970 length:2142 start_codon:yes stop_codon:yes gene_type:complete